MIAAILKAGTQTWIAYIWEGGYYLQIRTRPRFLYSAPTPKFHHSMFTRSEVIVLTNKQTNTHTQTNRRHWKHPTFVATLRRWVNIDRVTVIYSRQVDSIRRFCALITVRVKSEIKHVWSGRFCTNHVGLRYIKAYRHKACVARASAGQLQIAIRVRSWYLVTSWKFCLISTNNK